MTFFVRTLLVAAAGLVWIGFLGAGFGMLLSFSGTPGPAEHAPAVWPLTTVPHAPDRPTLVMVLHPECSCSRASLGELSRVLARTHERPAVIVLFAVPHGLAAPDAGNPLWQRAAALPGVQIRVDRDGGDAARFGPVVSGTTYVYGADGRLQFSGGITVARAHAGDNAGEDAVAAILDGRQQRIDRAPAFGCPLQEQP